jgi:hypothetical protein
MPTSSETSRTFRRRFSRFPALTFSTWSSSIDVEGRPVAEAAFTKWNTWIAH